MCYCNEPQNPDRPMIMCDKCEEWFHITCALGSDAASLKQLDSFFCTACRESIE
jgi:hypothetical protein